MGEYLLKRTVSSVIAVTGVSLLTFLLLFVLPGDPAEMLAIAKYGARDATPEAIDHIIRQEGLDRPLGIQYARWLKEVLGGDLGKSRISGKPVWQEINTRLPATLFLAGTGLAISLCTGLPLGIVAAMKRNTVWDYLATGTSLIGVAVPNFWLGLILILVFGLYLGWLPTFGCGTPGHLVLPAVTVGISMAGITARLTRSAVIDVLGQAYVKTARAKGLPKRVILGRHVLKNALIPIVTIAGLQLGHLLEGTVIVETIFAWPGIGRLLIEAVHNRDVPQIQGCVLYIAVVFCAVNLFIDFFYTCLDPRVRLTNRD
ncbi:ABC transporter permease [Desulfosarcina ovata subsp. sediminis]|uniref:ABC transporter permease n=1 Tax=Desulfosarcina ovata subsp. sediminis TaxID=885957 RepID=A0A5K7ZLV4_9BACT|nr:nickel ABC transporter permease [Desulfosarcina ovata]BBO81941.1 ABC transporter permease [Desulfosarcina ovata subsp. sediminis]